MEENNIEYIYYENENDNIPLDDFKRLLVKDDLLIKEQIIRIFFNKLEKDYIDPFNVLTEDNNKSYVYPATLLLVCCIDVLAKYYYGNETLRNGGIHYEKFMNEKFEKLELRTKDNEIIQIAPEEIYKSLRCALTHSNSTKYKIGFDELSNGDYFEYVEKNAQKVNIKKFAKKIKEVINQYKEELITEIEEIKKSNKNGTNNENKERLNNFFKILNKNYL